MVPPKFRISMVRLKFSKPIFQRHIKGRFLRPFFVLVFLSLFTSANAQPEQALTLSFDSFNYSEPTSLYSISGHWNDPITSGDKGLSVSRFTLGYKTGDYDIQIIYRDDSYYRFNNETVQFINLIKNKLSLQPSQPYKLDIRPNRSSSRGLRLGYNTKISDDLTVSGFLSLLKPTDLLQGSLSGEAQALESNDYDFDFSTDVVYKDDPLFERPNSRISGKGYAFDLIIDYAINQQWQFNWQILDIIGELSIKNAPFTQAQATSDIKVFDDNGFLQYNPVAAGFEGSKDVVYKLKTQSHLSATYQLSNKNSLVFQHHKFYNLEYEKLMLKQNNGKAEISWSLIPRLKGFGFGYAKKHFAFSYEADDIHLEKAKYLNIQFRYSCVF